MTLLGRARALTRTPALAAVVAQVWQAVGSFLLQVLAAWVLGAAGLGLLSLCLGIIVLATAVVSGMVGDSLVILDRHDQRTRAGLQFWALTLAITSMVLVALAMVLTDLLSPLEAVLMAAALGAFQLEELVRRTFMATMRFWSLVIIDTVAVLGALAVVGSWALIDKIGISTFFVGLLVGQVAGLIVGVAMLPHDERVLVSLRGAAIRAVAGFGAWRGAQISIPPLVLTAFRVMVTAVVGQAALGEVEAARIYAAPALLAVQGIGSYLLSSYARDRATALSVLKRRAWHASMGMVGVALLAGAALAAAAPMLARFVTGPDVAVSRIAVVGWALYVAGSASCQPFASLAAARGRPALVLLCRSVDAVFAVVLIALLLGPLGVQAFWMPYALAAGLFLGGTLVRQFALKPLSQSHVKNLSEPVEPTLVETAEPNSIETIQPRISHALR